MALAPNPPESPWLTLAEAVTYCKRSYNVIWRALVTDELHGNQTGRGGKWLVHRDEVDAWIRGEKADVRIPAVTRRSA